MTRVCGFMYSSSKMTHIHPDGVVHIPDEDADAFVRVMDRVKPGTLATYLDSKPRRLWMVVNDGSDKPCLVNRETNKNKIQLWSMMSTIELDAQDAVPFIRVLTVLDEKNGVQFSVKGKRWTVVRLAQHVWSITLANH